eukprot:TRINITY_DN11156_c0_g1_i1.p1 TRINITY_DN11156_c0_g1~~TRINITY_DN11156_c0_g1_i1.p1  ORF type:complete len:733 (-),score=123.73 TRINITY_DN11156_c0_g1_i1:80-2278(-)
MREMLLPGTRLLAGRRRPSQVLTPNAGCVQSPPSYGRTTGAGRAVSISPTSSPPAGGATPSTPSLPSGAVHIAGASSMLGSPEASEAPGSGMRRSSTANSLSMQSQLERPRVRSKSNSRRDHKAVEAALADAAPKPSAKGSPPKAFRVLPGRFSVHGPEAPPTPRRQTPRAPKRTPRLSPRCTLSAGYVGGRLPMDQDDRRRRRVTAITSAEVSPGFHEANLRRSASSFLMSDGAGQESRLPAGYPTVMPPASGSREALCAPNGTTNITDNADLAGGHQSAVTMSGATTPTDGGGEQHTSFARGRNSFAQAPDSRIMRLIGKRSVLRTSNGAPSPEVAQQRYHRARQRCALQGAAASGLASGCTSSSSVAAPCIPPETRLQNQPATGSRALRRGGAQSSSASDIQDLGSCGTQGFDGGHNFEAGAEDASLAARACAVVAEVAAQADRAAHSEHGLHHKNFQTSSQSNGGHHVLKAAADAEVQQDDESLQQHLPASDGAEGAIIWPGASAALKSETEAARFADAGPADRITYREHSDAEPGAAVQEDDDPSAAFEGKDSALAGFFPCIGGSLLVNEVGSLVIPQTWRYVPAPPAEQPQCQGQVVDGSAAQAARPTASEPPSATEGVEKEDDADDDQEEDCPVLDLGAKQQLVEDLVEYLMGKASRCEKELEGEQRANRALRMSLEVEQRRSALLQQQLAWLAHQTGFQLPEDSLLAAGSQGGAAEGPCDASEG